MDLYPMVRAAFYGQPWAIERAKFDAMHAMLQRRADGGALSAEELAAVVAVQRPELLFAVCDEEGRREELVPVALDVSGRFVASLPPGHYATGAELAAAVKAASEGPGFGGAGGRQVVAVIGLYGTMLHRATGMTETSGLATTDKVTARVRAAAADPAVRGIVLDVDSGGGSVYGVEELAAALRAARDVKPVKASVNARAGSAAYWAAANADEVIITPSGEAGSIGVFYEHEDRSAANEKEGRRYTTIAYGQNKAQAGPNAPLSEEAAAAIEKRVGEYGAQFERDVAKGRGVTVSAVQKRFGQGLVFGAKESIERGLADRVGTLDDAVARAWKKAPAANGGAAAAEAAELEEGNRTLAVAVELQALEAKARAYRA